MTTHSCNKATFLALTAAAMVLAALLWPGTGSGQTSSRRDRSRRDTSFRSSSSRADQVSRQVSEQREQVTKPVDPNVASAKPVTAGSPPVVTTDSASPRRDAIKPLAESLRGEAAGQWARYELILQRNIFSRQRTPYRPRDKNSEAQVVVVRNPETHFFLKGVVQEDNVFIAFIEDTDSGMVLRLRQGDRVARGVIKTLNLDALEYQLEDKTVSISLGCDLEGTRRAVTMSAVDSLNAWQTAAPAGQPVQTQQSTPAPSADEAEILKRLMEQRRQQLGQ